MEVFCLSPCEVKLKKDLTIGSLFSTESWAQCLELGVTPPTEFQEETPVADRFDLSNTDLAPREVARVREMLTKHKEVIGESSEDVGLTEVGSHVIQLLDPHQEPIKIPPRRLQGKARVDVEE